MGMTFWADFESRFQMQCVSELKHAILSHSCLGCRGLIPLLTNLCAATNTDGLEGVVGATRWQQEYIDSLHNRLEQLQDFPR